MDIATRRVIYKEIDLPAWAKKITDELGDDSTLMRKGISPRDLKFIADERAAIHVITAAVTDRDGEIVVPKGVSFKNYEANGKPVMWSHDYKSLPIGDCMWLKYDKATNSVLAKTRFAKHPFADAVYEHIKEMPLCCSIGFIPRKYVDQEDFETLDFKSLNIDPKEVKRARRIYLETEMLEYSITPIPSNPAALQVSVAKGWINPEQMEELYGIKYFDFGAAKEETPDEIETKSEEQAGADSDGEIQAIEIQEQEEEQREVKTAGGLVIPDADAAPEATANTFDFEIVSLKEEKVTSCTCPDCGETYPPAEDGTCGACPECSEKPEDAEEDACGGKPKKPKKSLDDIIGEVIYGNPFNSEAFPETKKEVRWNQKVSKLFDIASVPSKPASYTMAIYCQFLECKVKNIYQNDFFVWSPLMGSYLAGFKACSKHFKLKDTRAFSRYEQLEFPPSYEVIQINSKTSDDFLVQGSAFYDFEGEPIILQFSPDMYGLRTSIFTSRKNMSLNKNFIESVHAWVEKENPLKDEKMGLNGEFLEVDAKDTWETIVLSEPNLKAAKYAAKLINEKGMDFNGRGMLMVGPPGTGKTKIARILMTQTDHTFIWVSSKDLTKTWYPEEKIALGFQLARQLAPCTLCLEDIDNWIDGKIVDMMKTELDGVKKNKGVITILTTNNPEKLPSALLDRPGRFHDVLNFDVPTKELRQEMITRWAGELEEESLKTIVDSTEGYSGAYMWELIEFAKDIAESDDLEMADALVASLVKLSDQKELIQSIQGVKKSAEIYLRNIPNEYYEAELQAHMVSIEELTKTIKSGRRLSSTSINSLREALKLIEELIASSEPKEVEEEKSFEMEVTPEPEFDLEATLKTSMEDIFSRKMKHLSLEDIVSEAIKKAKGEIF